MKKLAVINKYMIISIMLVIPLILFCQNKYLNINFHYQFEPSEIFFTSNNVNILINNSDSIGLKVYSLLFKLYKNRKIYMLPERYIKYIDNDTIRLLIEGHASFDSDSCPSTYFIFPKTNLLCDTNQQIADTIYFAYEGKKRINAIFKNDTAIVNINWKMSDFHAAPFWFGDY